MDENHKETFLTTVNDQNQVLSCDFNEEDMNDIEMKSTGDSEDTPRTTRELEQILNRKELFERSSILIPHVESFNAMGNQT
jgi:hypothetical protein